MASERVATPPSPDRAGWPDALADTGPARALALLRLRAFLGAVGWFELERRSVQLAELSSAERAELARSAADVAFTALLSSLDDYHGQSRFHVWAAKFAIHEAAAAARRQ